MFRFNPSRINLVGILSNSSYLSALNSYPQTGLYGYAYYYCCCYHHYYYYYYYYYYYCYCYCYSYYYTTAATTTTTTISFAVFCGVLLVFFGWHAAHCGRVYICTTDSSSIQNTSGSSIVFLNLQFDFVA